MNFNYILRVTKYLFFRQQSTWSNKETKATINLRRNVRINRRSLQRPAKTPPPSTKWNKSNNKTGWHIRNTGAIEHNNQPGATRKRNNQPSAEHNNQPAIAVFQWRSTGCRKASKSAGVVCRRPRTPLPPLLIAIDCRGGARVVWGRPSLRAWYAEDLKPLCLRPVLKLYQIKYVINNLIYNCWWDCCGWLLGALFSPPTSTSARHCQFAAAVNCVFLSNCLSHRSMVDCCIFVYS